MQLRIIAEGSKVLTTVLLGGSVISNTRHANLTNIPRLTNRYQYLFHHVDQSECPFFEIGQSEDTASPLFSHHLGWRFLLSICERQSVACVGYTHTRRINLCNFYCTRIRSISCHTNAYRVYRNSCKSSFLFQLIAEKNDSRIHMLFIYYSVVQFL